MSRIVAVILIYYRHKPIDRILLENLTVVQLVKELPPTENQVHYSVHKIALFSLISKQNNPIHAAFNTPFPSPSWSLPCPLLTFFYWNTVSAYRLTKRTIPII
jgi:hypothetical protein